MRICDECNFGTYGGRCIICGGQGASLQLAVEEEELTRLAAGISDAYYCTVR